MVNIRSLIFNALKGSELDLLRIKEAVKFPEAEIIRELDGMIRDGYVVARGPFYRLKVTLDKNPREVEQSLELPKYSVYADSIARVEAGSESYDNPYIEYIFWAIQGNRGICTGYSGVVAYMLSYYNLTKDVQQKSSGKPCAEYEKDGVMVNNLPMNYASAEWLYTKSREIGHVTIPSGSYCAYVCKLLTTLGVCSESTWSTALSTPSIPEPKKASTEAAFHIVDGVAEIDTWDACLSAIRNGKGVYGSYNVYAGSLNDILTGQSDTFTVNGALAGQHANTFCRIRSIDNKLQIGSPQSWDCQRYTWIDEDYFTNQSAKFYVLLDEAEVKFFSDEPVVQPETPEPSSPSEPATPWWKSSGGLRNRK